MAAPQFYPALNKLIITGRLPEPVKTAVDTVSNKLFYRSYYVEKSVYGESAYHHIVLVLNSEVGLNFFGDEDGFKLLFNPGSVPVTTEIPLSIYYSLPILKYVRQIRLDSLSSGKDYFDLIVKMFNLSKKELFFETIDVFLNDYENPVEEFVDQFNQNPDFSSYPPLIYQSTGEYYTDVLDLMSQLQYRNIDTTLYVLNTYITEDSIIEGLNNMSMLFNRWMGDFDMNNIVELFIPKISVSIQAIELALAFPRTWLKPVDSQGNVIEDENVRSMLTYNVGSMTYDSEYGFEFNNIDSFDLDPSQIGNTGLLIQINNLKFDFRTDKNIPEADADGRPIEFQGIYADMVSITLPKKWFNNVDSTTLQIAGYNMLIGTGGVSGTVALQAVNNTPITADDYLYCNLGSQSGFRIGFNRFDITFKQNQVVSSNIRARLEITKLGYPEGHPSYGSPRPIEVFGHLGSDGDFNLTASVEDGVSYDLFSFLTLTVYSLELGKTSAGDFYIGTSAGISFPSGLMQEILGDQEIIIPRLRLYSNGRIELEGGAGMLPVSLRLPLGPVDINVTGIHLGGIQREHKGVTRQYNYIGFDGSISIDPFAIDARGEGVKYYYTIDNDDHDGVGHAFVHIKTLYIDVIVPANAKKVSISGMLTIPEPGQSQEYEGSVEFKVLLGKSEGLSGSAAMKLAPKHPAFLVDAEVTLPKPLIFGSVGIYGFRGLIGYRYVAEKAAIPSLPPTATWYDYYKHPPKGIHIQKFTGPFDSSQYSNPFSLGAGAVIGTAFDDGTIINARLMLLLSLPSMFMLEGRASILSARLGLTDAKEPNFWAMVAWGDNSVEFGMGAQFKIPQQSGSMFELNAQAHAYFPLRNNKHWYVHIGTKQHPNQAVLFKEAINLRALSYLMLSNQGMELGARIDFEINKRFFGIRVKLWAFVEVGAFISFERPQLGGYIHLGGGIEVNVWRLLYVKFSLDAYLGAEVVQPYLIYARLEFKGRVRVLRFLRIRFKIKLTIKWERNKELNLQPIPPLSIEGVSHSQRIDAVKGIHMLTYEPFDIQYFSSQPHPNDIHAFIPLDTYIDIQFTKSVNPVMVSSKIGGHTSGAENFIELMPPKKNVKGGRTLRQVSHQYDIESIDLMAWNGQQWIPYHPAVQATDDPTVSSVKIGYWQRNGNQYETVRILGNTPFSHINNGEPGWFIPEQYGITPSNLFCAETFPFWKVSNVLNKTLGATYTLTGQTGGHFINGAYYLPIGQFDTDVLGGLSIPYNTLQVTAFTNPFNFPKSLSFGNYNGLRILFPDDAVSVRFKLTTSAPEVKVRFYKSVSLDGQSLPEFHLVDELIFTTNDLTAEVHYDTLDEPICKMELFPMTPQFAALQQLQEQIEALYTDTYEEAQGEVGITLPNNLELYYQLIQELNSIIEGGCGEQSEPCQGSSVILCQLYDELRAFNCFSITPTGFHEVPNDCMKAIHDKLEYYLRVYQDECAPISSSSEYSNYFTQYHIVLPQHNFPSFEAFLIQYEQYIQYFNELLSFIFNVGKCDCLESGLRSCTTSLQEVRWKTWVDYQYELTVPGQDALNESYAAMIQGISEVIHPIWRPNTAYCIQLRLRDTVQTTSHPFTYHFGFKTAGPLGHFHDATGVTYGTEFLAPSQQVSNRINLDEQLALTGKLTNPEKYPLTHLGGYIDYRKSYPNPDSNLIMSKPLFYGHHSAKIGLFFIKPYLPLMFKTWAGLSSSVPEVKGDLALIITDPVSEEVVSYPLPSSSETIPLADALDGETSIWISDEDPRIPLSVQLILNQIQNGTLPCGIDLGTPLPPLSFSYQVQLTHLQPEKLYTVTVNNVFDANQDGQLSDFIDSARNVVVNEVKDIHSFVFKTSKYANFEEQVSSYRIFQEGIYMGDRVYSIQLGLSEDSVSEAYQILQGNQDTAMETGKIDSFDRIIESVFQLHPFAPAVDTEILALKSNDGKTRALLVRNPEPFQVPKIDRDALLDTFEVLDSQGNPLTDVAFLYSKDCSQILVLSSNLEFLAMSYIFKFSYKYWNGYAYVNEQPEIFTLPIQID